MRNVSDEKLIRGDYQKIGTYKADMSGFVNPELQQLLEKYCQETGCDPKTLSQRGSPGSGSKAGVGDAEHKVKPGLPVWLGVFQSKAEKSAEWGPKQKAWSRLMGSFFYAYFTDKYYAPNNMAIPANVEYFLHHLGKSNPKGADWKPKPRPGYVGNGAATFSEIGGGGANYCAAASSKALLNGLTVFGYKCNFIGYAPGGKGVGHGCPAKAQMGRRAGEANRPLPGDVLSIRTAIGPMSGHVITICWAISDGTKSGEMYYVSGNSAHASVSCDWAQIADAAGRPPRGSVAVINRVITSCFATDKLAAMDASGLSRLKLSKKQGDFPQPPKAGQKTGDAGSASSPAGNSGATGPDSQVLPDAPKVESTKGSGDVQTVATSGSTGATIIRLGKHQSEPPKAPAATASGPGKTQSTPGANAPGATAPAANASGATAPAAPAGAPPSPDLSKYPLVEDYTANAAAKGRKRKNPLARIDTICLHQMACASVGGTAEGNVTKQTKTGRVERWKSLNAHIAVTVGPESKAWILNDVEWRIPHGHGWNSRSVGIEVEGHFAGIHDLQTGKWSKYWKPKSKPNRKPMVPTSQQIEALKQVMRWIVAEIAKRGGKIKYVSAHRQSYGTKASDPGQLIWRQAALPIMKELGLATAPTLKRGKGIPKQWDPSSTVEY